MEQYKPQTLEEIGFHNIDITITDYEKVKEFMQKFGQQCPVKLKIPSKEIRLLRAKLILEEALETIDALGVSIEFQSQGGVEGEDDKWHEIDLKSLKLNVNCHSESLSIVNVLDGLCDLHYVGFCGTAIACGISEEILNKAFTEVHRSNMSKLWTDAQLDEGKKKYPGCVVESFGDGLYSLILEGKIIKSPSYSPANLEQFLI